MKKEIWKKLDFNKLYEISSFGKVVSLQYGKRKLLSVNSLTVKGYVQITIKRKKYLLHRLIAKNFIPEEIGRNEVNHKNGIKTDNRVENLEWVSRQENIEHAIKNNLHHHGEKTGSSKLTEKEVLEILESSLKYVKLAKIYNVSDSTIGLIKSRKRWKYLQKGKYE